MESQLRSIITRSHKHILLTFPPSITLSLCLPVPPAPSQTHTQTHTHAHWNKHTFQLNPSSAWWMLLPFNFNYAVLLQLARKPLCAQATFSKWWLNYRQESARTGVHAGCSTGRLTTCTQQWTCTDKTHTHTHMQAHKIRLGDLVHVRTHFSPSLVSRMPFLKPI